MKLVLPIGLLYVLAATSSASALPVFAHRYALTCQACHTIVPALNETGEAFRANGFRLPAARGSFPVTIKVKVAYASEAEDGLPKSLVDEIELLSAGSIGKRFSYFVEQYVVDSGRPGLPRDAWLQFDAGNVHLRGGQFTLPLPADVETERPTETHYLVYDQTVGSGRFNFFDPRDGIDASISSPDDRIEAHLAIVQSYDRQSGVPFSGLDRMASVRKRIGAIDAWLYRYDGQRSIDPFTNRFTRTGYALSTGSGRFTVTGALQTGYDSNAGDGFGARSSGGFIETAWRPDPRLWLVARYDGAYDDLSGISRQGIIGTVFRPAGNMRLTVEDTITGHHALTAALLFAY